MGQRRSFAGQLLHLVGADAALALLAAHVDLQQNILHHAYLLGLLLNDHQKMFGAHRLDEGRPSHHEFHFIGLKVSDKVEGRALIGVETPIGEEEDSHLGDFIPDETNMSPEDFAVNELLKDEISEVLLTLTEREEKVIRLRFGLEDGRPRTLEEVGQLFGVTRERIRQIEAKALRKLRHPSRSRKLKDYLGD